MSANIVVKLPWVSEMSEQQSISRYLWMFFGIFAGIDLIVIAIQALKISSMLGASIWTAALTAMIVGQSYYRQTGSAPEAAVKWRLVFWSLLICLVVSVLPLIVLFGPLFQNDEFGRVGGLQNLLTEFWATFAISVAVITALQLIALWIGYGPLTRFMIRAEARGKD